MPQLIPNLWINDGKIEEAVDFYVRALDGRRTGSMSTYPPESGEWAGQPMAITFELLGQPYVAINGADTRFAASEALSLAIACDTQEEIDRYWDALVDGGQPGPCGWLKDRYGFSWQVYPASLDDMLTSDDAEAAARVTEAFMKVDGRAFDIAELEAAYAGR